MGSSLQNVTELTYIKKMEAQVFWHFEKLFQDISRLSSFIFVFLHENIYYQTAVQAEEFNMNLTTCAMNGGEDYELLFTVPIGDHEKIETMEGCKADWLHHQRKSGQVPHYQRRTGI